MAKGPDWNEVHRADPGAVRAAMTEPDLRFDDAPPGQNGHAKDAHPGIADQVNEAINRGGKALLDSAQVVTRRASDITPESPSWIWKYWLARGKLHIIGGVPEAGKTTIALSYAAIVSSGGTWPDGSRATVGNVLIWTSEDDPADTLVPRLIRMGADLKRIHFIEEAIPPGAKSRPFNPATDMPALVKKAQEIGNVVLLILDPVVAALPTNRIEVSFAKKSELRKKGHEVPPFAGCSAGPVSCGSSSGCLRYSSG